MKKYAVDVAIRFPTESISRPMVFTETTRQRRRQLIHPEDFSDFLNLFVIVQMQPMFPVIFKNLYQIIIEHFES